jgi:hypothetical protein
MRNTPRAMKEASLALASIGKRLQGNSILHLTTAGANRNTGKQ